MHACTAGLNLCAKHKETKPLKKLRAASLYPRNADPIKI